MDYSELRKQKCPACDRKGLHFAKHPYHEKGKNLNRIVCRFCKKEFPVQHMGRSLLIFHKGV